MSSKVGSLVLLVSLFSAVELRAQEPCSVVVRLLSVRKQQQQVPAVPAAMSSLIDDMGEQLTALPGHSYEPLLWRERKLDWKATGKFELKARELNYLLEVTPQELLAKRVATTVDWRDAEGRQLLAAKIRVPNGESMVLGADRRSGQPVLLAISVSCAQ